MALTKEQWKLVNKSCKKLKKYLEDGFDIKFYTLDECEYYKINQISFDADDDGNQTWHFDQIFDELEYNNVIRFDKNTNDSFETIVRNINSFKIYQTKEIKNKAIIFMETK